PIRIRIDFTFSPQQLATAFESETGLSELLSAEMKAVRDTANIYRNQVMIDKIKSVINDGDVLKENLYNFNGYKTINRYDIGVINFENYFKNTGTEIAFDYLSNLYDTGDAGESNFKVKQKPAIEYFVDTLKIKLLNDLKRMSEPSRDFNVG